MLDISKVFRGQKSLSLRSNIAWSFAGRFIYAGCQWLVMVVLAKLGNPETVGKFALGLSVTAPVIMLASLQLRGIQATDAEDEFEFSDYLTLRLVTTPIALGMIALIAGIAGYVGETLVVIHLIALAKALESISDMIYGLLQRYERMDIIAISRLFKGVLSVIMVGAIFYATDSLAWAVVGLILAWGGILLFFDLPCALGYRRIARSRSKLAFRKRIEVLKDLTKLALPMGGVVMLTSLDPNIPRYFISHYFGEWDLGIYAAISYLLVSGGTVVNALGQAASPRLAKYFVKGDIPAFKKLLFRLLAISLFLGVAGVGIALIMGETVLSLLYSPDYSSYNDVFIWVMVVATGAYVFSILGTAVTAMRKFAIQLPIHLVRVAITVGLSVLWIEQFGLIGAAWTMLGGVSIAILAYSIILYRGIREKTVYIKSDGLMG